jgi:hypothetical protein
MRVDFFTASTNQRSQFPGFLNQVSRLQLLRNERAGGLGIRGHASFSRQFI